MIYSEYLDNMIYDMLGKNENSGTFWRFWNSGDFSRVFPACSKPPDVRSLTYYGAVYLEVSLVVPLEGGK